MTFLGFDAADFDAFLPKKQGSNAFTLERRRAKDKLLTIARRAMEIHESAVMGWDLESSEDAPSIQNGRKVRALAAFFVRPVAARSGLKALNSTNLGAGAGLFEIALHQQHAHLELRIDVEQLTLGVRVPPGATIDRENIAEKLSLDWAREDLAALLAELPDGTRAGLEPDLVDPKSVDYAALEAWSRTSPPPQSALVVEWLVPRTEPDLAGPGFLDRAAGYLARFAPVLRFLAWSKDNDHTRVQEVVAQQVEAAQQANAGLSPGTRVTILGGLFAGRSGYVSEVDHKGKVKVLVGPVTVTVDRDEVKTGS